jgi:hypothetical protein
MKRALFIMLLISLFSFAFSTSISIPIAPNPNERYVAPDDFTTDSNRFISSGSQPDLNRYYALEDTQSVQRINWLQLSNFPVACPAGTAITKLGLIPICSTINASGGSSFDQNLNTFDSVVFRTIGLVKPLGNSMLFNLSDSSNELFIYPNSVQDGNVHIGSPFDYPDAKVNLFVYGKGTFSENVTAPNLCYSNGTNCTSIGGVGDGNIYSLGIMSKDNNSFKIDLNMGGNQIYNTGNVGIKTVPAYVGVYASTNLALSKTCAESSDIGGYPCGNAFDGSTTTFHHTNTAANEWIKVDLGAIYLVGNIIMTKRTGFTSRPANFKVQYASDYAFTTGVTDLATYVSNSQLIVNLAITPTNIRYLRIYNTGSEYQSFAEIQVYEAIMPTLSINGVTYANGNVVTSAGSKFGVGTNPTEMLDVNGNINLPTTSSTVGQIKQNGTLVFHTYGTDNLFMGGGAGNFTNTGQQNAGYGAGSLPALTNGSFNAAFGYGALNKITSGSYNMAIGSYSQYGATTTSYNVGVGVNTLVDNTTGGSANTAIGYESLRNVTAGYNTGIGYYAGRGMKGGTYNTIIGSYLTDTQNITGTRNTALGFNAVIDGNLTNSCAIGANSRVSDSNACVIGGIDVNGVNVGIGTARPQNKLNVVGDINASGANGKIRADFNISAGTIFIAKGVSGIDKNVTIMKTVLTTCDMNFVGGILVASTC